MCLWSVHLYVYLYFMTTLIPRSCNKRTVAKAIATLRCLPLLQMKTHAEVIVAWPMVCERSMPCSMAVRICVPIHRASLRWFCQMPAKTSA